MICKVSVGIRLDVYTPEEFAPKSTTSSLLKAFKIIAKNSTVLDGMTDEKRKASTEYTNFCKAQLVLEK